MNADHEKADEPHYARMQGIRQVDRPIAKLQLGVGMVLVVGGLVVAFMTNDLGPLLLCLLGVAITVAGITRMMRVQASETLEKTLRKRDDQGKSNTFIFVILGLLAFGVVCTILGPPTYRVLGSGDMEDFWFIIFAVAGSIAVGISYHVFENRHGSPNTDEEKRAAADRNRALGRRMAIISTAVPLIAIIAVAVLIRIIS